MTIIVIADNEAIQKIPQSASEQCNPNSDFESVGSIANRVVSQLMAKMQKNVS